LVLEGCHKGTLESKLNKNLMEVYTLPHHSEKISEQQKKPVKKRSLSSDGKCMPHSVQWWRL
jgi:hypothetical protein